MVQRMSHLAVVSSTPALDAWLVCLPLLPLAKRDVSTESPPKAPSVMRRSIDHVANTCGFWDEPPPIGQQYLYQRATNWRGKPPAIIHVGHNRTQAPNRDDKFLSGEREGYPKTVLKCP